MSDSLLRRIAILDACVVAGASLAYVVVEALQVPKRWSFLGAGLLLGAYGVHLARRRSPSWRELGFRADNLRAGLLPFGAFTGFAGLGLVSWGLILGLPHRASDVLLLLALYPPWALVQQLSWSLLFRRCPNLWLLAASHTVLAALAYPLVLGDAPSSRF